MQINLITTLLGKSNIQSSLPDFDALQQLFDEQEIDSSYPPAVIGHVYGAIHEDRDSKQLLNITLPEPFILTYNPADHSEWSDLLDVLQALVKELITQLKDSHNESELESDIESAEHTLTDS